MNKKILIGILLVVVVFIAGIFLWNSVALSPTSKEEESQVRTLIENFGSKLKEVYISDPKEIASAKIKEIYAPFVTDELLLTWTNDPSKVPGRLTSSPWPERIEIRSIKKFDLNEYEVDGDIISLTSAGSSKDRVTIFVVERDNNFLIYSFSLENPGNTSNQPELPEGIDEGSIRDYLQNNIVSPSFCGKVFCAYDLFGSEIKDNKIYVYLWTLCMEYCLKDGKLIKGSGVSMPVVLIASQIQQGYKITEHKEPMNGSFYAKSIKELFPEKYYKYIFSDNTEEYNQRADRLLNDTEIQAEIYYNLK